MNAKNSTKKFVVPTVLTSNKEEKGNKMQTVFKEKLVEFFFTLQTFFSP